MSGRIEAVPLLGSPAAHLKRCCDDCRPGDQVFQIDRRGGIPGERPLSCSARPTGFIDRNSERSITSRQATATTWCTDSSGNVRFGRSSDRSSGAPRTPIRSMAWTSAGTIATTCATNSHAVRCRVLDLVNGAMRGYLATRKADAD